MPSDTSGFSGSELVSYVTNWIGNTSSEFQSFITQSLPLAEFRYCKLFDWPFLKKRNLSLTVASGTAEYTLSVATLGFYMQASDVENVYSVAANKYLKKTTLDKIRRQDPDLNDGSVSGYVTHWAPVGDNQIILYPGTFADTSLRVDGKITPGALSTLSNYPTIPYHNQDGFITYLIALALDRENDDRANAKKQEAFALIKQDMQEANSGSGNVDEPRIKSLAEARADGSPNTVDPLNMLFDR